MHRCEMDERERIIAVEVYQGDWMSRRGSTRPVVSDVKFITKAQTCGHYGTNSTASQLITGHQLLYISGQSGVVIDRLTMNFDYNCSMP